ncbi:WAT1-related protein At2g37460-like isoform X1 [Salvia splendens]|uniref:WAT1-related protein At2g37460-like isoform X1 n=2 Tax=Salvia splendens TaxID=180675 RepID=UPI001C2624C4|nr:WAT1-related protein At2g37460-like isoform X1 [Salvia splendens]
MNVNVYRSGIKTRELEMKITKESLGLVFLKAKPFLAVVFLQAGLAGMDIISKAALNEGMSNYVFVVYRHAVATLVIAPFAFILDKKVRPKMTISTFLKIMLMSLLEPVIDQNLYFLGMKYTTATFAAAMANVLPAITFVMAWCFRLEKVELMSVRSQAKILGTLATIAGAMIMTLVSGPNLDLPWTRSGHTHDLHRVQPQISIQHTIKGALLITIGCFSWAGFMILQAVTLRTYPAELSLTAWICLLGTAEGAAVALVAEKGNAAAWAIKWDTSFLAAVYSGIFCSGIAYYVQGVVMKERGPVFVTAFSPLGMIIVAVLSSIIFSEKMYLGRVVGAGVIVMGLYFVVWGKQKDYKSSSMEVEEIPVKLSDASKSKLEVFTTNVDTDERLV